MGNIMRYDPMDDLFRGFFVRPFEMGNAPQTPTMKVDVKEDEKAFVVHAELPGVKKHDIHVMVDGNTLSISAEMKHENEVKEGERLLRSERYFGKISRSFQLAQDIDDSQAVARFENGVLELTLPKRAEAASRRLQIA